MSVPNNPMGSASGTMPPRGLAQARPRPTGPTSASGITSADIWRILRTRLLLISVTAICVLVPGVILNLLWNMYWPSWPGTALLEVKSPIIQEVLEREQLPVAALMEMYARSEATAIKSRAYARAALQDDKVKGTDWYKRHKDEALLEFEDNLTVTAIRETPMIRVSFHTRKKGDAPRIVNTLVDKYLDDRKRRALTDLEQELIILRDQRDNLSRDLDRDSFLINDYIKTEDIPAIRGRQTVVETQLAILTENHNLPFMVSKTSYTA